MKKTAILAITLVFFVTLFILGCIGFIFNNKSKESTKTNISTSIERKEKTEEIEFRVIRN